MKNVWFLGLMLIGCEPGKVADSNEDPIFFNWEEGDESPRIAEGFVYCISINEDEYQTFINVVADDPQGHLDIKEGIWRAFNIENGDELTSGDLVCDKNDCISSFYDGQRPPLQCQQLSNYRFEAEVFDWQDNSTGIFDLRVLEEAPN